MMNQHLFLKRKASGTAFGQINQECLYFGMNIFSLFCTTPVEKTATGWRYVVASSYHSAWNLQDHASELESTLQRKQQELDDTMSKHSSKQSEQVQGLQQQVLQLQAECATLKEVSK